MIKHIVLGCGGPTGFINMGILKYLYEKKFWNYNDVKSIYGSSVGAVMAIVISLKINPNDIESYIIHRNWSKYIEFTPSKLFNAFQNKHLIDTGFIHDFLKTLLYSVDLDEHTTLLDLYKKSGIFLHIYTVDLNTPDLTPIELNHETFPELTVIKAAEMTCAIPILFKPIYYKEHFYIDGGLLNGFPLNHCLSHHKNVNEILAIQNEFDFKNTLLDDKSSMISILGVLIKKILQKLDTPTYDKIPYYIYVDKSLAKSLCSISLSLWKDCLIDKKIRKKLIKGGRIIGKTFLKSIK